MGRFTTTILACLAGVLVSADAARAQYFGRNKVHYEQLDFKRLQTEHFDIYYYPEEEAATVQAARMAERWYARYSAVLSFTFAQRQPVVLYAGHPHFAQTNLTSGLVNEATGGFTESVKSRIAMPFVAALGETGHVLGHEIAHAFQIAVSRSVGENAFALPLWFIEGMAEYLSVGSTGAHTAMWIRDAALYERLPTLEQMEDPRYFPYRFGHAFWSYVCGRFGDGLLSRILRLEGSAAARLREATGLEAEALFADWHASIRESMPAAERVPSAADAIIAHEDGRIHVGPALSPDGERVMFLSERGGLSLDLFLADASTGQVLRTLVSTAADPHFDSLQYIHSAGAWEPTGRRFAITAVRHGAPVLVIANTDGTGKREEVRLPGIREIYTPGWSPDGSRIVFSGLKGGVSDLFVYELGTGELTQLTDDAFADLHPVWSPDGLTIAFATDRFTTTLETLAFGPPRIGLMDVESRGTRQLLPAAAAVKQISPQWEPGGAGVYFVSDREGVSNVYHLSLATRELRQVTAVDGGVSGIAPESPALAVAARSGALAYSVYRAGRYEIRIIDDAAGVGSVVAADWPDAAAVVDQHSGAAGDELSLARLLGDPVRGLPDPAAFTRTAYDDRLRLESISHPTFGVSAGGGFGGLFRAGFGLTFTDLLKDRQLQSSLRVGTTIDDFAAQIAYTNRKGRWNWGVAAGFQPSRFYAAKASLDSRDGVVTRETSSLRYLHQWGGLVGRYHIDSARRIEIGAGLRRTGFQWSTFTRVVDQNARRVLSRDRTDTPAGAPIFLAETQVAFVHDAAVSGPLGPLFGQRLRVDVQPAFGPVVFADVIADARRYFMPFRPVTFAARVQHVGRYGPDAADPRLTPLIVGLHSFVRGYDLRAFASDQCGRLARACSVIDELTGSRFALINLEARAPIPGLFSGELSYGRLVPVEAIAFLDAGYLWTRSVAGGDEARFRSVGAGARFNLGGAVFELTGARPFDRADRNGWTVSFLIRPGW